MVVTATLVAVYLTVAQVVDCPPAVESAAAAEEKVFSGPQVEEELPPFKVRGVFDDDAGKELDFVAQANGGPLVLIFVHDVNRPSVAMTRALTKYTVGRKDDGLTTGVVWLTDDATEGENMLNRVRHALTPGAAIGVSLDGQEGPGSYGLNREVTLTILVGKEGRVTGNFALVQPSLQADLPKVLEAVIQVAGGEMPKLEELVGARAMMREEGEEQNARLRRLLRPVIQRDASDEAVDKAAKSVEELAEKDESVGKEVGRIARTIVEAGKLENYGTTHAQEYIAKWAKSYGGEEENKGPEERR